MSALFASIAKKHPQINNAAATSDTGMDALMSVMSGVTAKSVSLVRELEPHEQRKARMKTLDKLDSPSISTTEGHTQTSGCVLSLHRTA